MNTSPWTDEEHVALAAHIPGEVWAPIAERIGRSAEQCWQRYYLMRKFYKKRGRWPLAKEMRGARFAHGGGRLWAPWEDEYVRLVLRHADDNVTVYTLVARGTDRSREAARQRVLWLDYDPEELISLN